MQKSPLRRLLAGATSTAVAAALAATVGAPAAQASDSAGAPSDTGVKARSDNYPNPLAKKQAKLRKQAMELLANGKADKRPQRAGGSTVTLSSGKTVEFFDNSKQANVWTVLSEFGTQSAGRYGSTPGPLHNQIPEPDRARDNSTQWTADFNRDHYDRMFNGAGESFRNFYLDQSNGQYDARVTTEDWVKVPYNGSYYGDNAREDNGGTWDFIDDTVDAWAGGRSTAGAKSYLAQFDKWDRYDFDEDGNFNEADGYIDHFQAVHAGPGEEAGADADAIWSHRWYADYTTIGQVGPTVDGRKNLQGGQEIGDTGYFIGDYTVEPENGGLGVFAHEYGHDLGLPDFYDTAGGENSTGFWTLMSSGSWMGHGADSPRSSFLFGIGGTPNDMGPEEKLFLGWLNPTVVSVGQRARVTLDAAGAPGSNQAVQVLLPDETKTRTVGAPYAGTQAWYSDAGDDLSNTLNRDLPAADSVTVAAKAWYDTEADYDYWYAQYSTDGGVTWTNLGVFDGASDWTDVSFTYSPNGQPSKFRFLYKTDGGVSNPGVMLDNITTTVNGSVVDTDGAETTSSAWTSRGWLRTTGTITETSPRYYLMENRSYVGYDTTLRQGPYNFSETVSRPDWVEHFPYQNGMLVWYVNHSVADNNTSEHPGTGYALPVDAMATPLRWDGTGAVARNRIQAFDSTFGLESTDALSLSRQIAGNRPGSYTTQTVKAGSRAMVPTFDDTKVYWDPANPTGSVKVAGAGVKATVVGQSGSSLTVALR